MRSNRTYSIIATMLLFTSLILITTPILGEPKHTNIRIDPYSSGYPAPVMLESPATFTINVTNKNHPAYDPYILLVISQDCYDGMDSTPARVTVSWDYGSISFDKADFGVADDKIPSLSLDLYEGDSLKSKLGVPNSEDIYIVYGPFLASEITVDEQEFTVELHSSDPRMLVYAYGKTEPTGEIDNRVPNSQPGFVIPEIPGTILGVAAMIAALIFYTRGKATTTLI